MTPEERAAYIALEWTGGVEQLEAAIASQIRAAIADEREAIIAALHHGMQHCETVKMIRQRGAA